MDKWLKGIDDICEQLENVLITQAKFEKIIYEKIINGLGSPLKTLTFSISVDKPFEDVQLGCEDLTTQTQVQTHKLNDFASCRISFSLKQETETSESTSLIFRTLLQLIKGYWKPNLREKNSRLSSFRFPEIHKFMENTLADLLEDAPYVCVCFGDLDKFKLINDTLNELEGDRVITEFSSLLEKNVRPNAIPLHRSGDEFIALIPVQSAYEALVTCHNVMNGVAEYDFKVQGIPVAASWGISVLSREDKFGYEDYAKRAEKALKPLGGEKQRGKARFEAIQAPIPKAESATLNLAFCRMKSTLASSSPFSNPWLNYIAAKSYDIFVTTNDFEQVRLIITNLINWIQPEWSPDILASAVWKTINYTPVFSPLDVILAITHGIFRSSFLNNVRFESDKNLIVKINSQGFGDCQLVLMPDDKVLLEIGNGENMNNVLKLGLFPSSIDGYIDSSRALLILIGHSEFALPPQVFDEIIIVDDRPSRGGGLPDFWEATIARLIGRINENPNIAAVYVLGNKHHAKETVRKLEEVEHWNETTERISYKTGMKVSAIISAAEKLNGLVEFVADEEQVFCHLKEILQTHFEYQKVEQHDYIGNRQRYLNFKLETEDILLGIRDGCIIKTAAEAYPLILEIARKDGEDQLIRDQAGLELIELVDFKVRVLKPTRDQVPAFYEDDRELIESYFNKEFLSEEGLFGKYFKETGQKAAVINHLVAVLRNSDAQFCTRRAILVIPHVIEDDKDITPLGLVSVRIFPRFTKGKIILNFSYTWRTVEALVGFPYSMYGSLKFSEHLTELIKNELGEESATRIELGEVSYIAHSLHIFMDDYAQNIARRIINDASI